jgi:hypothetical protein
LITVEGFPVLILGYMRFEGILRNLEACQKAGISRVYLALDGPKDFSSRELQNHELNRIWNFAEVHGIKLQLRQRHSNVGLAVAVIEGISWFFENEEYGAILEDDLEISTDFFYFAVQALDIFHNNQTIALVSGNNFQLDTPPRQVSATHYPLIWGWATRRALWNDFLLSLRSPLISKINWKLPLPVNAFWWTAAMQSRDGFVDSWAMSFSNYIRMRDLVCVLPPVNLISNIGVDDYAIHSNSSDPVVNFPIAPLDSELIWQLPTKTTIATIDRHLEELVFRISRKSLLSPIKFIVGSVVFKHVRPKKSLLDRLKTSSDNVDFSLSERAP